MGGEGEEEAEQVEVEVEVVMLAGLPVLLPLCPMLENLHTSLTCQ